MAERGMLPEFFAKRSRYETPSIGILFSASGVILLSQLSFREIVAAEIFLYCFGMILKFIAFVRLRIKYPDVTRLQDTGEEGFGSRDRSFSLSWIKLRLMHFGGIYMRLDVVFVFTEMVGRRWSLPEAGEVSSQQWWLPEAGGISSRRCWLPEAGGRRPEGYQAGDGDQN
ncbi:hypothetical protein L6452_35753 [Arctium lappa]|uniref:Uncharacterized protein n=1 Tax=Arctium lappa TaxID=4217 RepID=A0ACB8Y7C6_ARCLA|nr:hypothetical protein L6452_35753 [Arctium lappa]